MKKLLAIGEALIDMIPSNVGKIMNVNSFSPKLGGAPLNYNVRKRFVWRQNY